MQNMVLSPLKKLDRSILRRKQMKKLTVTLVMVLVLTLVLAGTAFAITNGQPDGDNHPYVGIALGPATGGGFWVCSAAAISPTVLVTAAHCFETEDVLVSFLEEPLTVGLAAFDTGKWYPDPEWCIGCSGGLPGFDSHDVAVIVLDEPVSLPRYGQLPSRGFVDTLPPNTKVDLVGYGVQFDQGGGPRWPADGAFTRYYAPTELVASNHVHSDEYIKLRSNPAKGKGGICFGDSGGPDLLGGTDVILAVNSYGSNSNCAGVAYSNRIDTYALDFIQSFLP
jgi:secreted trypsin-like serine protease